MASTAAHDQATSWVQAAPFRAHVRHVCDTTGVAWPVLAMRAGVSLALADHLLHGRRGRPVRRISRESAARLLAVTPGVAAALAAEWVDAGTAVGIARFLADRGWSPGAVSDATGIDAALVRALRHRPPSHVTRLVELGLRALAASDDRALASRAAA